MPAHSAELRGRIARAGAAKRWGKADAIDRQRELATERLAAYIEKAPTLRADQVQRLIALLGGIAA